MPSPKVSIIVPVYNRERTLVRCLRSISSQSFSDLEVIIVNDGSTDNSKIVIEEYIADDNRFKLINKCNGGVASARQVGKEIAKGNYAIHVDPDDWIEPSMIQDMYEKAISDDSDMVICDLDEDTNSIHKTLCQKPENNDSLSVLSGLFKNQHGSCCNKLISYNYYKFVDFEPGINITEDLLYISKILMKNPKTNYIPKAYYHYMISSDSSQSKIYNAERFYQINKSYSKLISITSGHEIIQSLIQKKFIPYLAYIGLKSQDLSGIEYRKAFDNNYMFCLRNLQSFREKVAFILAISGLKKLISAAIN